MTKSLPNKLSPLGPELMKLLQKKKEPSIVEKPAEPKKRRIITVIEAIEETPPSASAPKTAAAEAAPAEASTFEAAAAKATNLENTLSDIDEMILNMAEEEIAAAAEETPAAVPEKGRRCLEKRRSLPKMLRKKEISTFKT
jgi:tRNA A37 N6-isopentenylltransferase MiaA